MWYTQYHFLHHIQQQTVVPAQKAGNHYITEWEHKNRIKIENSGPTRVLFIYKIKKGD